MTTAAERRVELGARVHTWEQAYAEVMEFLVDEACLLDGGREAEWLELVTHDITYRMPERQTVHRADGPGFSETRRFFDDDYDLLAMRVKRNTTVASALDRDPPARLRRIVSTVVVHVNAAVDGEYLVASSLLVLRNCLDRTDFDLLSARRDDLLRRTPSGLRLADRTVWLDQACLESFVNVLV